VTKAQMEETLTSVNPIGTRKMSSVSAATKPKIPIVEGSTRVSLVRGDL
jgi:hypothetical protein